MHSNNVYDCGYYNNNNVKQPNSRCAIVAADGPHARPPVVITRYNNNINYIAHIISCSVSTVRYRLLHINRERSCACDRCILYVRFIKLLTRSACAFVRYSNNNNNIIYASIACVKRAAKNAKTMTGHSVAAADIGVRVKQVDPVMSLPRACTYTAE